MMQLSNTTPIIFGASGLLGGALFCHFKKQYPGTIGTYASRPDSQLYEYKFNNTDLGSLPLQPSTRYYAIICSSLTNIGFINANPVETAQVNVDGTIRLIKQLTERAIPILFVSSDNVFTGNTGGYTDDSEAPPVSEYGRQKRAVEQALMALTQGQACIVRLAKIIGDLPNDGTILNDIIRQLFSEEPVKAASDLIFNPTYIGDIVTAIEWLIQKGHSGTFHFCNPEAVSRYELAQRLAERFAISPNKIIEIKFRELDPTGKRPLNTTMLNSHCFQDFSFTTIHSCIEQLHESIAKEKVETDSKY